MATICFERSDYSPLTGSHTTASSSWNADQTLKLYTWQSMQSNTQRYWFKAKSQNGLRLTLYGDPSKTVVNHKGAPYLKKKDSNNPGDVLFHGHRGTCATDSWNYITNKEGKCNRRYLTGATVHYSQCHETIALCRNMLTAHLDELKEEWEESVGINSPRTLPLYASKVRIQKNAVGWINIVEVEVYSRGTNVALQANGGTAELSTTYASNYDASTAVDGLTSSSTAFAHSRKENGTSVAPQFRWHFSALIY